MVSYEDAEYPELLRNIAEPPFLLYCHGNVSVLGERSVSVVGTRRISPRGRKSAHDFAYEACLNGCGVVSGLAYGADGYAHRGAVDAFYEHHSDKELTALGKTIAVLPGGIDEIVPQGNKFLAEKILKSGGCIVSEYEPGVPSENWRFVARNRIIAGLSPAVVVRASCGAARLGTEMREEP